MSLDRTQKLAALKRWAEAVEAADQHFDAMVDLMGLEPEGPTLTVVYALQGALTNATAELVGDSVGGTVSWYWLDNDMGRKGMRAGRDGDMREIRTLEDLLWLLDPCGHAATDREAA